MKKLGNSISYNLYFNSEEEYQARRTAKINKLEYIDEELKNLDLLHPKQPEKKDKEQTQKEWEKKLTVRLSMLRSTRER